MENENILELVDVKKLYPGVVALNNVSLNIIKGEVHALAGENGAGKSTLIKIITGAIEPTAGKIIYEGKEYSLMNPQETTKLGIAAIYQEFNLIPYLTAAENIFLGREPMKGIFIDKEKMFNEAKKIFDEIGVDINPRTKVKDLGVAYQQIVEIAKSISKNAKLLIMDEPTAPLTNKEIESLFKIVRHLKQKGVSIIYISHRLEEIFSLCDRVSIMRDGDYISTKKTQDTNRQDLISMMVGRQFTEYYPTGNSNYNEVVLEVENLTNYKIKNICFSLKKGEIIGFGGLVGSGRTETMRAIFGADPLHSGTIKVNGKVVTIKSPVDAMNCGIGLIPEDRKHQGVILGRSIKENITFSSLNNVSKSPVINKRKESNLVNDISNELQIKAPSMEQLVKNLSGGNQQKVVLAKWIAVNCDILIFDEPTRGIDVGAKQEIYKLMRKLAEEGKGIIMVSSDMLELLGMSDRIIVMNEGHIVGEVDKEEATQEVILDIATRNKEVLV